MLVREEGRIEKAGSVDVGKRDGGVGAERPNVHFDTVKGRHRAHVCRSAQEHGGERHSISAERLSSVHCLVQLLTLVATLDRSKSFCFL